MKKIVNFLNKLNTPLFYAIISAVFGLAFLFLPTRVLDILLIIVGSVVAFAGLVLLSDVDSSVRGPSYYIGVIRGVAVLVFGIVTAIARSGLSRMLCSALGVYILIKALPLLVSLIMTDSPRDRVWWKNTVISIIEVVLGLWMMIYPIYPSILTGIVLLVVSVDTFLRIKDRHSDTPSSDYYEADFEDKS